jgi:hypothetical protein
MDFVIFTCWGSLSLTGGPNFQVLLELKIGGQICPVYHITLDLDDNSAAIRDASSR